jgi:hypothetical protein
MPDVYVVRRALHYGTSNVYPCSLSSGSSTDSMNAWEDEAFRAAVQRTGKKRLIFGALYTEICLAFPVIDALRDGYDVTFVVDAVGGLSQLAHRTAVRRSTAAGAVPNTALALATELFRDWASPLGPKGREIIKWYVSELQQLSAAK